MAEETSIEEKGNVGIPKHVFACDSSDRHRGSGRPPKPFDIHKILIILYYIVNLL
jgi:hypothetical protein